MKGHNAATILDHLVQKALLVGQSKLGALKDHPPAGIVHIDSMFDLKVICLSIDLLQQGQFIDSLTLDFIYLVYEGALRYCLKGFQS